jgi:hypothetical protein
MRLHSYVLDHDYGFAPNPFFSVCTLATCKPTIREHAVVGDYIVGTGCAKRGRRGFLTYFMVIEEVTDFDGYWVAPRFIDKRPKMRGSKMQSFGDNIYHRDPNTCQWIQENSLHSYADGSTNHANVAHDTKSSKVLIGSDFAYWGGSGPEIPKAFRDFDGVDVCCGRGHRNHFSDEHRDEFIAWMRSLRQFGYIGDPLDWVRSG